MTKMFTIFTQSQSQKNILEQDYATFNDRFHVKLQQSPAIAGILRSISFELFQSSPPQLAQTITKIAIDSLHLKLSLALYREVLVKIKKMDQLITLYRDYFNSLSVVIEEPSVFGYKKQLIEFNEETSAICVVQRLESYPSSDVLITDFQDQLQKAISKHQQVQIVQKTRKTAAEHHNDHQAIKQTLQISNNMFSHCDQQGNQWWKIRQREEAGNSSREISQFERHKQNMLQNSIGLLVQEEEKYEKKRQQQLANKEKDQSTCLKFNKKIKQKLLNAKLKRRRRR